MTVPARPRIIETEADLLEGLDALERRELRFAALRAVAGPVPLRRSEGGLRGLARTIIAQQVSVASAAAITGRLLAAFPDLTAEALLAAEDAELRACGLSAPKMRTLRAVALAEREGRLDFGRLAASTPEEVHAMMTAVPGIGPWTADIYLMFHLGHADAFAPGDLALQEAVRLGFGLEARPDTRALAAFAAPWAPWRAAAARLLWAYYGQARTREAQPA